MNIDKIVAIIMMIEAIEASVYDTKPFIKEEVTMVNGDKRRVLIYLN